MEQFLKWMYSWAKFIDGFLGIITFGQISTSLPLKTAKKLARWRHNNNK